MPADILVLMTDQHRADWIGAYGAAHVRTPNLDRLASEGALFTRCHTTSPVCMPARVSFLTGMFPHNFGMWDHFGRLHDTQESALHALKAAGYRTSHVGKSHLSPHGGKDLRDEEPYMHALGWDDVHETTGPLSTQTTSSILTDWMQEKGIYDLFIEDYRKRRAVGMNKALWPSPLPDGMHADDFITETALGYIEQSGKSQPLYLFVGLGGPHNPWDPPERFDTYRPEDMPAPLPRDPAPEWLTGPALDHHNRMMSANKDITPEQWARVRSLYSARVEHLDYCIGKLLDSWYAARGRDTWVLFWSDHGEMLGDKGRAHKCVYYEPVVRVPAIIRPPSPRPVVSDSLVTLPDLTASILDAVGAEPSPNTFGRSLLPIFEGEPVGSRGDLVISEVLDKTMLFDGRWKLVINSQGEVLKLFDTSSDPTESTNLAGRSDMTKTVQYLKGELLNFLLRTADRQFREVNR